MPDAFDVDGPEDEPFWRAEIRADDLSEDEYQINIPQSFVALFVEPGRQKPSASRAVVAERYELCEDLANMMTDSAVNMVNRLDCSEREVLERCQLGLTGEVAVVSEPEARWVILRLAELLGW